MKEELQKIYDSEINVRIESFWDAGWRVAIMVGDKWKYSTYFDLDLDQIVLELHNTEAANAARKEFELRFQKGDLSQVDLPLITAAGTVSETLTQAGLAESRSEAKRLINQRAVKWNNQLLTSDTLPSDRKSGDIIKAGRKAARLQ